MNQPPPGRLRGIARAAGVLALAVAAAIGAVGSSAALPPAPPQVILDTTAHAVFSWSVPNRYDASWAAYNPTSSRYNINFVNPTGWSLRLNACASTSKNRVTGYRYTVSQVGAAWRRSFATTACRLNLNNYLPAQGSYRVTLTLTTRGAFDGVSLSSTQAVRIRDILIVSMGDSLASGEGNPDVLGRYTYTVNWRLQVTKHTIVAARWKDQRCHRSANSGPARAAKAIEYADPHTSVTFVSVACSGAEIQHLVNARYAGSQPVGSSKLPPQSQAVADLVGPHSLRGGRPIDALLVSAGINDLKFSDIIERCATNIVAPWHDSATCVTKGGIAGQVTELRRSYAYLAQVIALALPNAKGININDYPARVFQGGGCGVLGASGLGISSHEGAVMTTWGERMNAAIATAATSYLRYRWHLVGGMEQRFTGHGYCAAQSWFNTFEKSMRTQGNNKGTAHPNLIGHAAYGAMLRSAIRLG